QHLASLSQYGADAQRDSCWSFCTPAIAVGYPRWWRPDELGIPHQNRPQHGLPDTGEYLDGFGNKAYVHAIGNPIVPTAKNRYDVAHQKGSGFGFVTVDTEKKTYYVESFRFLVDATDGKPENQFPGWPVTIHQEENRGVNRLR
ncbi:MAG TPA: twin-arginine translocation pathway signal, partial [Verrucomicrobiales bacterium]|nr:twin-arginine translocation pathway signal [Verrucomicrobiales bacterium]